MGECHVSETSVNLTTVMSGDVYNDQKSGVLPLKESRAWCVLGRYSTTELHCSQVQECCVELVLLCVVMVASNI